MHNGELYCCLGVACEISERGNWITHGQGTDGSEIYGYKISDTSYMEECEISELLPLAVTDWLGITFNGLLDKRIRYENKWIESLTDANDAGMSFAEIADIIESEYIFIQ